MATRREVRESFYSELETAASGHLTADDITQEQPNSREDLPRLVHSDRYRPIPMNRGAAPVDVNEDSVGVQERLYTKIVQAQFVLNVLSDNEQEVEDIYEAVRSHFDAYTHPFKDASNIQSDIYRVEVQDVNPIDLTDREPPAHGDSLAVNCNFQRFAVEDVDPATDIDHQVDADNDDITDVTYTTN